jgi:hypothetical protein
VGFQYDDQPHWEFTVVETSAGVYNVNAVRNGGITGGGTGTDPDALLDEFKRWAQKVENDLDQRRRDA